MFIAHSNRERLKRDLVRSAKGRNTFLVVLQPPPAAPRVSSTNYLNLQDMAVGTRSTTRNGRSKEDPLASANKDITPPPKRTSAATKTKSPTIVEAKPRGTKDVGPTPKKVENFSAKSKKRRFVDSEGSDEDTGTHPTNITPSRGHEKNMVTSSTNKDSDKNAIGVVPSKDMKKIEFPALEDMASKKFIKLLAGKGINARKTERQGFSKLEVDESEHQTEVCWKSITGSKPPWVKLPDTAEFGQCSVFAIEASTKESFEKKAEIFLGSNMGSQTLKRSMALVLRYDSDGKPRTAIVAYPMGESLYYCDSLKAETANKIAMELNRGKDPIRWHLDVPREPSSKRRKLDDEVDRVSTQDESDTSND